MYIKKKVYLKNTNRASIKEITDFGMILRPYNCLLLLKSEDGDTPVNVDPCAHSMGICHAKGMGCKPVV